jgi:ABC-type multidrug transport system ATPase subunit
MSDSNIVIKASGLGKRFGAKDALTDLDLEIPERAIYGVLGPNGAGKTTLFSLIAGFIKPTSGSVSFPLGVPAPGKLTILPQDARFQANAPVLDQIVYMLRLQGMSKAHAASEVRRVLALVGLENEMFSAAEGFSHGMYKRLCLAQAFVGSPSIVILDEPTGGLDHRNARVIRAHIKKLAAEATVLVASHDLAEMQELCTHVAVLDSGRLAKAGAVREVAGNEVFLTLRLSRDLTDDELDGLTGGSVRSAKALGESSYRVGLLDENDASLLDKKRDELARALLDAGVTIREMKEDNAIQGAYDNLVGK